MILVLSLASDVIFTRIFDWHVAEDYTIGDLQLVLLGTKNVY